MSGLRFRTNLFWTVVLIAFTAFAIRWAVKYVMPVVPYLVAVVLLFAAARLALAVWRRRQGYY